MGSRPKLEAEKSPTAAQQPGDRQGPEEEQATVGGSGAPVSRALTRQGLRCGDCRASPSGDPDQDECQPCVCSTIPRSQTWGTVAVLRKRKGQAYLPPGAAPSTFPAGSARGPGAGECSGGSQGRSAVLCVCSYGVSRSLQFQLLQFRAEQLIPDLWAREGPGRSLCARLAGVRDAPAPLLCC